VQHESIERKAGFPDWAYVSTLSGCGGYGWWGRGHPSAWDRQLGYCLGIVPEGIPLSDGEVSSEKLPEPERCDSFPKKRDCFARNGCTVSVSPPVPGVCDGLGAFQWPISLGIGLQ